MHAAYLHTKGGYAYAQLEKARRRDFAFFYRQYAEVSGYKKGEIEKCIEELDCESLLQSIRHHARTVYEYEANSGSEYDFEYRGRELFPGKATMLYREQIGWAVGACSVGRFLELWITDDLQLVACSDLNVDIDRGAYQTDYRMIKGDPLSEDFSFEFEELNAALLELCPAVFELDKPVYEC